MLRPEHMFYPEMPTDQAQYWSSKLKRQPAIVQFQPIRNAAYLYVESTYIHGGKDMAVPIQLQKWMVARCKALGVNIDQEVLDHSGRSFAVHPVLTLTTRPYAVLVLL